MLHLSVAPTIVSKLVLTPTQLYGNGGYLELHDLRAIVGKEGVGAMLNDDGDVTVHLKLGPDKLYVLDLTLDSWKDVKFHFLCNGSDASLPLPQNKHVLYAFKAPSDGKQDCIIKASLFGAFTFFELELSAVN